MKQFKIKIVEALAERKLREKPEIKTYVIITVVGVCAYLILALLLHDGRQPYLQFREGWAVNALSAYFLGAASAMALYCFVGLSARTDKGRWLWLLMGLGYFYFCLDEQLEFHERIGDAMVAQGLNIPSMFRNWNDVVVIVYGLIAGAICIFFITELLRYRLFFELLMIGALFYVIHTGIDTVFEGSFKRVPEESAKLFANAFFALAFLAGALGVNAEIRNSPPAATS